MTKTIRVENACPTPYPVRVTTEDKQADGTWKAVAVKQLQYPTAMDTQTIHSTRRIVIEELGPDAPTGA